MIGFTVVMPSFERALQKAKGKLFPFGFIHLLQAKKNSKEVVFYLIGVSPEYQNKGITAVIFDEYYKVFKEKNIKRFIRTPELEENTAMHNSKTWSPTIHKRRRRIEKTFNPTMISQVNQNINFQTVVTLQQCKNMSQLEQNIPKSFRSPSIGKLRTISSLFHLTELKKRRPF